MIKVLIFSLNYYPFVGGAEVAVKEISDRLSPDEYEFHVLAPHYNRDLPKEERMGNVFVHRYALSKPGATITDQSAFPLKLNKYIYQATAARKAEHLHKVHHFDATWAMMAHASGIPAGIFKKRHPEVKYLLTLQEGDPPEYIEKLFTPVWPLFVQAFTRADYMQTISTFLLRWGRKMGFHGEAVVIPNAVDTKRFIARVSEEELVSMRERLHIVPGEIPLVTTSRLVHKNAVDDVIRALVELPEKVTFIVCGIGPLEDELRKLTSELGLEKRVRFVGQVDHQDLPAVLQASSIFIRPSRSEGMGNSFIEAMAAGIPVIATQEGGISDFLFDEKINPDKKTTGWAVRKDTPTDIAEAVTDILSRPEKVKEVTDYARELVVEKYDWDLVAKDMDILFRKMCVEKSIVDAESQHRTRLLIATPLYPPEAGGPASYSYALEQGLPRKEIGVTLLKFSQVRHLPKGIRHVVYWYQVLKASYKSDALLALDPVSVGFPTALASLVSRKPFFVKIVGDYAWEQGRQRHRMWLPLDEFVKTNQIPPQTYILRLIQTFVAKRAKRIIVPSEYLKHIVTTWGISPHKIDVIYNAVPVHAPSSGVSVIDDLSHPRLITVGRLVPWKGIQPLIEALITVREKVPTATLIVVGEGPERETLTRYAKARLPEDAVVFTGQLDSSHTLSCIRDADMFVLNSTYEGLSHVLIEAMSLGKPIIATRAGGNPELIEDGVTGRLVSVGNKDKLIDTIIELCTEPEVAERLAAAAVRRAQDFSQERMLDATASFLKKYQ